MAPYLLGENMIKQEYNLDVTPGGVTPIINRSQYDDDFSLIFHLYSRNGELTIESDTTATVEGTKSDGLRYYAEADLDIDTQTVTVTGDQQMTAVAGRQHFEIRLTHDGRVISTADYILCVNSAAFDISAPTSQSEVYDFKKSASEVTAAAETTSDNNANVTALYNSLMAYGISVEDGKLSVEYLDEGEESTAGGSQITEPPILDTTGQKIATALEMIAATYTENKTKLQELENRIATLEGN